MKTPAKRMLAVRSLRAPSVRKIDQQTKPIGARSLVKISGVAPHFSLFKQTLHKKELCVS